MAECGRIVVVSDRHDRSRAIVESVLAVADCHVTGLDETWDGLGAFDGVIADISLDRPEARSTLRRLTARAGSSARPLICVTHGVRNQALAQAQALGATACLSALSEPRLIVDTLARCVWPDRSLADLLVSREAARAGSLMRSLFGSADESGRVSMAAVERTVDPVLDAIHQGGLSRWLHAVWTHDDVTFQHCLLVSGLSAAFAQSLGLSKPDQQLMTRAALVHDVGKSKIPLAILNKPGRLDPDEQDVMRRHASLGAEILEASGGCDPIVLAVTRHHHEMLDGSGYPDGLSANAIADPIRLLTICDIYAALIERRSYKAPMSAGEALRVLSEMGTGGKLEAGLVSAFARTVQGIA